MDAVGSQLALQKHNPSAQSLKSSVSAKLWGPDPTPGELGTAALHSNIRPCPDRK